MMGSGPPTARLMIVGEAPGAEEVRRGAPFVGQSGYELDRILHDAGLLRAEAFVTNVCRVRPPDRFDKGKLVSNDITQWWDTSHKKNPDPSKYIWSDRHAGWVTVEVLEGTDTLDREIALVRPTVILALGNLALQTLAGERGITKWRGSYLPGPAGSVVIPAYHPAAILRAWHWRFYAVEDFKRAARWLQEGPVHRPDYHFIVRPNYLQVIAELLAILDLLDEGPRHVSCDIETRAGMMACLGLGLDDTVALCIPFMCVERKEGYWSLEEEVTIHRLLRLVLTHPNIHVSGQNFVYDSQYIQVELGYVPNFSWDTMITHHTYMPGTDKGLDVLSSLYCRYHRYWKDDGKTWDKDMNEDQLWEYNCEDCCRTWEVAEAETAFVEGLSVAEQHAFQHRMWWHCLQTMLRGIRRNEAWRKQLSVTLHAEIEKRRLWLEKILGHPFDVASRTAMDKLFHIDFGLKPNKARKTGNDTLNEESLRLHMTAEPLLAPIVKTILEIRSLGVYRSTFIEAKASRRDHRIRCSYNIAGTETFRLASSKDAWGSGLNLQNVPSGGEDEDFDLILPNVREGFIPDEGHELFDMDLDSADLRIVQAESNCRYLKEVLDAGKKVYVEAGKEYYQDDSFSKRHHQYTIFKSLIHGTHYLGTARGLAGRLGLGVRECERLQQWYYTLCPEVKEWQERIIANVKQYGQVSNAYGYTRRYFDRIDGTIFNQAAAWIPQSTIGLLINHIWDSIIAGIPGVEILLQVHDSLVGQYPVAKAEWYRGELLRVANLERVPYAAPLHIPVGFKYSTVSWGACE